MFRRKELLRCVGLVSLFVLPCLGITGCTAALGVAATALYGQHYGDETNVVESSYAATDYIVGRSNNFYDGQDLIVVEDLTDYERSGATSYFGRLVAHHIRSRMTQLGYNVEYKSVPLEEGYSLYAPEPVNLSRTQQPKIIINGTYKRERPDVSVVLNVTEVDTGYVITSFEYFIDYSRDVKSMSKPEIGITRVEK